MLPTSLKASISVVVPVYNGEKYLYNALESIKLQSLRPAEVIIINDGSIDGSGQIIHHFANSCNDLFHVSIHDQHNQGQASARNVGINLALSDFVAFLDQDDVWKPNHLEKLHEPFLRVQNIGWSYSDFDLVDAQGKTLNPRHLRSSNYEAPHESLLDLISQDLMMLPTASLVKTESLKKVAGFDAQFIGYEDDDLFLRLFFAGNSFFYVNESTLLYRVHDSNSSGNISFPQSRMKFYEKYRSLLSSSSDSKKIVSEALDPRITDAILQNLFVSIKTRNKHVFSFEKENLDYLFTLRGWTAQRRFLMILLKVKPLFYVVYRIFLQVKKIRSLRSRRTRAENENEDSHV
jgi:glycosyltransferase involved in cell wall biosynthesis